MMKMTNRSGLSQPVLLQPLLRLLHRPLLPVHLVLQVLRLARLAQPARLLARPVQPVLVQPLYRKNKIIYGDWGLKISPPPLLNAKGEP